MRSIWRYDLPITDRVVTDMPAGARVLPHVEVSNRAPYAVTIWAMVDPTAEKVEREFAIFGTGNPVDDEPIGAYVGTVVGEGALVWHVFEVPRLEKGMAE